MPAPADSAQSDNFSVLHMRSAADIAPSVSAFSATQLPVKKAIVDEFTLLNKYFTSVPSYSSPNHAFAQSATSCGVHVISSWISDADLDDIPFGFLGFYFDDIPIGFFFPGI